MDAALVRVDEARMSERSSGMRDEELRALAEAATATMTCGGHRNMGSLMRCAECNTRSNARSELSRAASPDVVLGLLDRLAAAEGAVARVWELVRETGFYIERTGWDPMDFLDAKDITEADRCGFLSGLQSESTRVALALEGHEARSEAAQGDAGGEDE